MAREQQQQGRAQRVRSQPLEPAQQAWRQAEGPQQQRARGQVQRRRPVAWRPLDAAGVGRRRPGAPAGEPPPQPEAGPQPQPGAAARLLPPDAP